MNRRVFTGCLLVLAIFLLVACGKGGAASNNVKGLWKGIAFQDAEGNVDKKDCGTIEIKDNTVDVKFESMDISGNIKAIDISDNLASLGVTEEYLIYVDNGEEVGFIFYFESSDSLQMAYEDYYKEKVFYSRDGADSTYAVIEDDKVEQRNDADVRNVKWGDSIEMVKKCETADFYGEDENELIYETSLNGCELYLLYQFDNGKLYQVGYTCKDGYSSGQIINFFYSFTDSLTEKYGEPEPDGGLIEMERESLIEMAGEASALEYGYTAYRNEWKNNRTRILLGAHSQNYKANLVLSYEDINNSSNDSNDF